MEPCANFSDVVRIVLTIRVHSNDAGCLGICAENEIDTGLERRPFAKVDSVRDHLNARDSTDLREYGRVVGATAVIHDNQRLPIACTEVSDDVDQDASRPVRRNENSDC